NRGWIRYGASRSRSAGERRQVGHLPGNGRAELQFLTGIAAGGRVDHGAQFRLRGPGRRRVPAGKSVPADRAGDLHLPWRARRALRRERRIPEGGQGRRDSGPGARSRDDGRGRHVQPQRLDWKNRVPRVPALLPAGCGRAENHSNGVRVRERLADAAMKRFGGGALAPRRLAPRALLLLLALGATQLIGCSKNSVKPSAIATDPETVLTLAPIENDTTSFRVHFYWNGYDRDGTVVRYHFAVDADTAQAIPDWRTTTAKDTTFLFLVDPILEIRRHAFMVSAVDDKGRYDKTPARRFFSAKSIPPTSQIEKGPSAYNP